MMINYEMLLLIIAAIIVNSFINIFFLFKYFDRLVGRERLVASANAPAEKPAPLSSLEPTSSNG